MSVHINSEYHIKALLEAFKKEYPYSANGLTLDMFHSVLDKYKISISLVSNFCKKQTKLEKMNKFLRVIK